MPRDSFCFLLEYKTLNRIKIMLDELIDSDERWYERCKMFMITIFRIEPQ